MRRLFLIVATALTGMAFAQPHLGQSNVEPLVPPGYAPGEDARMDERGIWMEMTEAELQLQRSPLLLEDTPLSAWVKSLGCEVAGAYCNDITIYVIRNPAFNASMAPNGTMLVHTGLITRMISSDQLAAVIGHEIAHYTQAHSLKRLRAAKNRMTVGMLVSMGLAVGGVSSGGLPEMFALSSVMSFTRDQESEADAVGAVLIRDAGYEPAAAGELWRMLEAEEEAASVKHPKGPFFLSSHPQPEHRARALDQVATALDAANPTPTVRDNDMFLAMLHQNYALLMDEQVKQRDFGRLQTLLDRHERLGVPQTNVAFYRGEAWRLRGGAGDHEHALREYRVATADPAADPRAHRELGYLLYKHESQELAKPHFSRYLALAPEASDREMIEFYLQGGW